jgi:diguanylate cyclase (GGDEF)-like protein
LPAVTRTAEALRVVLLASLAAGVAVAGGEAGFWGGVPPALVAAATGNPRVAGAAAVAVLLAAAVAAPPALMPAAVAAPACVAVVLAVRVRLERERDAARRSALHDPLTGLANRRALGERLRYEVARHHRNRQHFALLALDLDGFKTINDRFGHDAGDEVLRDVAAALRGAIREQDTAARLGGDEFCVLAPETGHPGAAELATRVRAALAHVAVGLGGGVTASVGAAVFPFDGADPSALLRAADAAALSRKRLARAA